MATRTLRRTVATAALAGFATAFAPMAVSLVAPTAAAAATSAPAIDKSASVPAPNGSLATTGSNISAVFDQQITGQDGSSATKCKDTSGDTQCSFVLYEVNADGSRGSRLPGTTSFAKSGSNPVTAVQDTVVFDPLFNLVNGNAYEAVVQVFGVDSKGAKVKSMVTNLDYKVFINTVAPYNLSAPQYANTQNNTAFPLSGYAPSGFTVSVVVPNPQDPTHQSDAKGSTFVDPCDSAPLCPWTATVDISGSEWPSSASDVKWTASEQDANGDSPSPNSTAGPTFTIDYTPPDVPTSTTEPKVTSDTTQHTATLSVNAQEADTATNSDVIGYLITVTDPSNNKVTKTFPSSGNDLPTQTMDVTTLDDGQLTVLIQAVDSNGNVSSSSCSSFPGSSTSCYSDSNQVKTVGLFPNLGTSILSSSGGDTTFEQAQQGQSVLSPTKVTVGFTQTIEKSWNDCCGGGSGGPVTHDSSMCIATPNGNCIASATPTVASDNKSISMKVGSKLPDGQYAVHVQTYSKSTCPDLTAADYANPNGRRPSDCENYNDLVRVPGTGSPGTVFTFTVNSVKPTVSIDNWTHPVTAKNEKNASFSGTVTKSVSSLSLLVKSSGSTTTKLLFGQPRLTITQPTNSSDPNATWSLTGADLSSLPDGTLTIKATAKTSSGLTGTDTVHAAMKAHQALLTEKANKGKVTFGHHVKVTGKLTDGAGAAISGENVTVKAKYRSGSSKSVRVITDSTGHYTALITPKHNATLVASYAGSPQHDGVTVKTAKVGVRFAVTFTSPKGGAHTSSTVHVAGKVRPSHAGASVTFYRHTSSGNVVVGHAKLNKKSNFSATLVLPPGTNKVLAKVKGTKNNLAGTSKLLTLHVS